jgi:hypothetical protein
MENLAQPFAAGETLAINYLWQERLSLAVGAEPSASIHQGQHLVGFANGVYYTIVVTYHKPTT